MRRSIILALVLFLVAIGLVSADTTTWTFDSDTELWSFSVIFGSGLSSGFHNDNALRANIVVANNSSTLGQWQVDIPDVFYESGTLCVDVKNSPFIFSLGFFAEFDSVLTNFGAATPPASGSYVEYCATLPANQTVQSIAFRMGNSASGAGFTNVIDFDNITLDLVLPDVEEFECSTVSNADFSTEDTWLLSGTADIDAGALTLGSGDSAAQNVSLSSNKTYQAVVSVSDASEEPVSKTVEVVLGTDSQIINVTGTGVYGVQFTTPTLSGPLIYGLQYTGPETISIDFTCLSLLSGQSECLAPDNGDFSTDSDWDYFRDASYNAEAKSARLPSDPGGIGGLIIAADTYTMPALDVDEHLILSFDAQTTVAGSVAGLVQAGESSVDFLYDAYQTFYTYEIPLDTLAELEDTEFRFANGSVAGLMDIDNVCVFVTDRLPNLPEPADPNSISPVDFGFNFTSCDLLDNIFAGFGVNMAQYRADYEAGFDFWDPTVWLVSAIWVNLAALLCFLMAGLTVLVSAIEYLVNNFLNYANWFRLSLPVILAWLLQWVLWFWQTATNVLVYFATWVYWIWQSATNVINWFIDLISSIWGWLAGENSANELRLIANQVVAAWNGWTGAVGEAISYLVELFIGLWNDNIRPYLQMVLEFWATFHLFILVGFYLWDFIWLAAEWLWVNIFQTLSIPMDIWNGFNEGVQAEAFEDLFGCSDGNLWCFLFAGFDIINQSVSPTILYPLMIIGIVLGTILILKSYFVDFYEFIMTSVREL